MATIPTKSHVREAATLALPTFAISGEEFDNWLKTHDSVVRAQVLKQAAQDYKDAGFPLHPDWWLRDYAGNADQTFGPDW